MTTPTASHERGGRSLAHDALAALDVWTSGYDAGLHSGDVGWQLRHDDDVNDGIFHVWHDVGEPAAFGMADGPVLRMAIAPGARGSVAVAESVADVLDGIDYVDTAGGVALRRLLLDRGWRTDPDPWVLLYADLTEKHAAHEDAASRPVTTDEDVDDRVAVQRSAFAPGSTFTADLWRRMASGPTYDRRFEIVTRTPDGAPAAAATGWFAGPGRCAILEPVGTHQDHQRRGYGTRVNLAVMAALARAGASGIRVHTPASNSAAVAAYESCGLRQVDWTTALMRG